MSKLSPELAAELAEELHRERCDMGRKDWKGCRDPLGRGCEDIIERALAPLVAGWLALVWNQGREAGETYVRWLATDAPFDPPRNPYRR